MNHPDHADGHPDAPETVDVHAGDGPGDSPSAGVTPVRRLLPRVRRSTGSYAGILALSLILALVAGVLSGLFRPVYMGRVMEDAAVVTVAPGSQEFDTWLGMITGSSILGIVVALIAFFRAPELLGPRMLAWVTFCSLIGAFTIVGISDAVAHLVHPVPAEDALQISQDYAFIPQVTLHWGVVIAPYLALLTYWSAAVLVRPDRTPVYDDADRPPSIPGSA
ncbi:hypothetical protein JIM95_002280 [Corynebacterium sp. CCM 8835]|uniref:DUF2567 domain-containing protein n=1 Tax=Corynebacterium antarcticum TaxID=2800405 RepID=A0ABS1FJG6_9CORY|nr:hypothetical protein [Corynebacterium antarcticum]MCL0244981.1 hypothetical protein [Corynebacterium antarcticum]